MTGPVRLVVTGGRSITREQAQGLVQALTMFFTAYPTAQLAHGDCKHPTHRPGPEAPWQRVAGRFSADKIADEWVRLWSGLALAEPTAFPVDPLEDGNWPEAGPRRNRRMVRTFRPTHGIAAVGGNGTANCVKELRSFGVAVLDLAELNAGWR